mmetsp:Transcript_44277/g.128821  ORF Transcript_44277/g.128821 Transcript_44277/m.128821 type:complete len:218 (+) Transcript_44277:206-859(+)
MTTATWPIWRFGAPESVSSAAPRGAHRRAGEIRICGRHRPMSPRNSGDAAQGCARGPGSRTTPSAPARCSANSSIPWRTWYCQYSSMATRRAPTPAATSGRETRGACEAIAATSATTRAVASRRRTGVSILPPPSRSGLRPTSRCASARPPASSPQGIRSTVARPTWRGGTWQTSARSTRGPCAPGGRTTRGAGSRGPGIRRPKLREDRPGCGSPTP